MEESLEAQACGRFCVRDVPTKELSLRQQVLAATAGGIATALFVTPFDVVKTRLQAQFDPLSSQAQPRATGSVVRTSGAPSLHFSGTKDAFVKIVRVEGVRALWRGLTAALVLTVPANSLYFMLYDRTKTRFDRSFPALAPVFAGLFARTVTVCFTAPLELMRTYVQSHGKSAHMQKGITQIMLELVRSRGIVHLWTGLAPTLWRDVPFSIIYWSSYEYIKHAIQPGDKRGFLVNFVSGAGAGCLAASFTTPIDVVKTRRQMSIGAAATDTPHYPPSSRAILRAIVEEEGMRGLVKGIVPRTAKVAPACALMIASYEFFKQLFLEPPP